MKQIPGFESIKRVTPLNKKNMKIITKAILSILVTAVIGAFTVIVASPKKATVADDETMQAAEKKQKENLFI